MKKVIDVIQFVLIIFLIIFGLIILYQVILKILGGSWETEAIILTLLALNIGFTFTITFNLVQLRSDHNHLTRQFGCLARDFKDFKEEIMSKL